jgi:hypothetical protein
MRSITTARVAGRMVLAVSAAGLVFSGIGAASASGTAASVTRLHASTLSAVSGQHVTFYATVSPAIAGAPTPTGSVTFAGAIAPVSVPLTTNATTGKPEAKIVTGVKVGTFTITATYNGDSTYAAGATQSVTVTVAKANTSTTMTATQSSVSPGHWTVTINVRPVLPGRGVATGTVAVNFDGTPITVALNSHANGYLHATLAHGATHTVTATYGGDSNFNGSSGQLTFTS